MLGGTTTSYQGGLQKLYVVKTDNLGNEEWYKTFGGAHDDPPVKDLIKTKDNYYVFTSGKTTYYNFSSGFTKMNALIIKINENGNVIWNKEYALYGDIYEPYDTSYAILYSLKELEDGSLVGVGYNQLYNTQPIHSRGKFFKFNSSGDTLYTRTYKVAYNYGSYDGLLNVIQQTNDNGFIIGGWAQSAGMDPYQQIWLVKVDSLGYDSPSGITEVRPSGTLKVYPNPSCGLFYVQWKTAELSHGLYTLYIHDLTGRLLYVQDLEAGSVTQCDVQGLSAGMYCLSVVGNGRVLATVKVVRE